MQKPNKNRNPQRKKTRGISSPRKLKSLRQLMIWRSETKLAIFKKELLPARPF